MREAELDELRADDLEDVDHRVQELGYLHTYTLDKKGAAYEQDLSKM